MKFIPVIVLVIFIQNFALGQQDTIYLWPKDVPGQNEVKAPAVVSDNHSGDVTRLAKVTNPLLIAFYPESQQQNKSIVVCPGGGYVHMAVDKEGYEVAKWLNSQGITAYVLQYRVPQNRKGALQDAQRAVRIVRNRNPEAKIGIMGFSAGGSLSARTASLSAVNSYAPNDLLDSTSARPDFAALIYPAYLDEGENRALSPELSIDKNTPPLFVFGTADDKYGNSALVITTAMRDQQRPVELHFLPEGGHGYGLRPGNSAAETWPQLLKNWLLKQ